MFPFMQLKASSAPSPSPLLSSTPKKLTDVTTVVEVDRSSILDMQMGFAAPFPGGGSGAAAGVTFLPFHSPCAPGMASVGAADGGLTFNHCLPAAAPAASRKRPRDYSDNSSSVSFLGDDVSSHVHGQMLDVDVLVLQHNEKVRLELKEKRRLFAKQVLAVVEHGLAKRLKAKDEEIEKLTKLNWALEERLKTLYVENQIWRDLAQSNEATANVLRSNLEQVLAAQVKLAEEGEECGATAAVAADAESCCCADNGAADGESAAAPVTGSNKEFEWRRACRRCWAEEPSVLLLPCRHLCVCAACGPAVDVCPVCNCCKNGSVHVNMS